MTPNQVNGFSMKGRRREVMAVMASLKRRHRTTGDFLRSMPPTAEVARMPDKSSRWIFPPASTDIHTITGGAG
ncbi:hypothetical protein LZ24_02491 [Desulfobotulus alkaliphilus]|uniref:Uncharacterized protein n=1 Tax=Desulfobotulus alkaliphilus TaxID=622671 RepID=A0A562RHE6_9BACT|nr:hypothetical protein [Desulfobotulus alkaliphilus]TWI68519.1 hypothetical protein LZ24_02491 [Desulfobotulus alkaliphilus]